jgi:Periplasmic binding protein
MRISLGLAAVVGFLTTGAASAQISSLKIGVLTDMSGVYADPTGPGSVFPARQAVQDFLAGRTGNNIEVIAGDHQNKPDIGSAIANRWIDVDKVDVIVDVPTSSVAFCSERHRQSQEQGFPRLRRGGIGPERITVFAQHRPLDLRYLGPC